MKTITILGSTGSIGQQTIDVITQHPDRYQVKALVAHSNIEKLTQQALILKPEYVVIEKEDAYHDLKKGLQGAKTQVLAGSKAIEEMASLEVDCVVSAIVGIAGLRPTYAALAQGNNVALANKESLVSAGTLLRKKAQETGAKILPLDSEHNAIFQVWKEEHAPFLSKITLTASGGPFWQRELNELHSVTPEQAIRHPKWNMGPKISVDSATLMNKALELIEAHYLFDCPPEKLDVLIHPESIIHSLVSYQDGSVLAQLGIPDMRIAIGYALAWPNRLPLNVPLLDLAALQSLSFYHPDLNRFRALSLAKESMKVGNEGFLNVANEVAVERFLNGLLPFTEIIPFIEHYLEKFTINSLNSLDDLLNSLADFRLRIEKTIPQHSYAA